MVSRHDAVEPGVVGVVASDSARFSVFAQSLTALEMPPGSEVVWRFGHQMAAQTNQLVEALLDDPDKRWLWILGDDHVFSPGLLTRLLSERLSILVPLCLRRFPPYAPVIFSGFAEDGRHRHHVNLDDYPDGGVVPIHSAGSGGMLVRREVFERIPAPWFESYQIDSQEVGEDLLFCDKARAAGFPIYCNLDQSLGHCVTGAIWPVRERGGWTHGFSMMGGYVIRIPKGGSDGGA